MQTSLFARTGACAALPRLALAGFVALAAFLGPTLPAKPKPTTDPERAELGVVLLSPEFYIEENFPDVAAFAAGTKPILEICREAIAGEKAPPKLLVQVTLRRDGAPLIELAGNPALAPTFATSLREKLAALALPRPPLCDIALRFQSLAKGEDPFAAAVAFSPKMPLPANVASDRFVAADLTQQLALLRDWARHEALPVLAHSAAGVDPKFAGVAATGRMIQQLDLSQPLDVEQLTYRNPDFWRGVMEMSPGNQLVGIMPLLLFIANGEIAKANHLFGGLRPNALDKSSAAIMLNQLGPMLSAFSRQHRDRIKQGIALHDQGRYDEAIAVYRKILADYPGSAWARYELFFSDFIKQGIQPSDSPQKTEQVWDAAAVDIYRRDPLYETQMSGIRGKNFGAMIDRMTLRGMQEKPPAEITQLLATKAEVALHLECYGEAALFYWQLLFRKGDTRVQLLTDKEPRTLTAEQLITRYLYCLERLGAPEWKQQFKGDFPAAFRQLEAELEAHRKQ